MQWPMDSSEKEPMMQSAVPFHADIICPYHSLPIDFIVLLVKLSGLTWTKAENCDGLCSNFVFFAESILIATIVI